MLSHKMACMYHGNIKVIILSAKMCGASSVDISMESVRLRDTHRTSLLQ